MSICIYDQVSSRCHFHNAALMSPWCQWVLSDAVSQHSPFQNGKPGPDPTFAAGHAPKICRKVHRCSGYCCPCRQSQNLKTALQDPNLCVYGDDLPGPGLKWADFSGPVPALHTHSSQFFFSSGVQFQGGSSWSSFCLPLMWPSLTRSSSFFLQHLHAPAHVQIRCWRHSACTRWALYPSSRQWGVEHVGRVQGTRRPVHAHGCLAIPWARITSCAGHWCLVCCTLGFCSTLACTLLVLWQYSQIS